MSYFDERKRLIEHWEKLNHKRNDLLDCAGQIERTMDIIERLYDDTFWWERFLNYCHTGK